MMGAFALYGLMLTFGWVCLLTLYANCEHTQERRLLLIALISGWFIMVGLLFWMVDAPFSILLLEV